MKVGIFFEGNPSPKYWSSIKKEDMVQAYQGERLGLDFYRDDIFYEVVDKMEDKEMNAVLILYRNALKYSKLKEKNELWNFMGRIWEKSYLKQVDNSNLREIYEEVYNPNYDWQDAQRMMNESCEKRSLNIGRRAGALTRKKKLDIAFVRFGGNHIHGVFKEVLKTKASVIILSPRFD